MRDIDHKILNLLMENGLISLDLLVEKGLVEEHAIDGIMNEILEEETVESESKTRPEGSMGKFGRYRELEAIGSGGMAEVYKAYDPELRRHVALKFLRIAEEEMRGKLLREAKAQARIGHPNVCHVYEVGELEERPYIAMQYISGKTLKETTSELTIEEKIVLIREIASALHEAHRIGLIHRDIKPSNVMVERQADGKWTPYLVDFGLARELQSSATTLSGERAGTPWYMSPEQAAGNVQSLDRRSDVFSLGVMFYELLCGKLPSEDRDRSTIQQVEPVGLRKRDNSIPVDLETIVMKCLEKEPHRRYESAKELSEDVQRYLDGEPILAQPPSFSYRLLKKTKKNKFATSALAAGIIVALFLCSLLFWVQWRSRIQSRYANQYGQEVRYIDTMLRSVYMAPLHDIRRELNLVRERLRIVERQMQNGGRWSYGPGNYALGHGYLFLRDYEKARLYLERAWELGYQDTSAAYALGQVMGVLYQKALIDSEQIENREVREARKQESEKRFKAPAIEFLKKAIGYVELPEYVEGLIAFYEARYDEALAKTRDAYSHARWSFEPLKLEGDIYAALGRAAFEKGEYQAAAKALDQAGKAYASASEIGRSEQGAYLGNCNRWLKMMRVEMEQGIAPDRSFKLSLESCDKAILVNPETAEPYRMKWDSYYRLGEYQIYNTGLDPRPAFEKAIEVGQQATVRNPKDADSFRNIGTAYQKVGEYEVMNGRDPRALLEKSIHQLKKALQINSRDAYTWNNLGNVYIDLGEFQMSRGENPGPALTSAIRQYEMAIQFNPRFASVYNNVGIAYQDMAEYEMAHGQDPTTSLRKAIDQYRTVTQINPQDSYAFNNLSVAFDVLGEYQMHHGVDPGKVLQQAANHSESALRINPKDVIAHNNMGIAYLHLGENAIRNGQSPDELLKQAMDQFQKTIGINSNYSYAWNNLGLCYFAAGEYEMMQGKDPRNSFEKAILKFQESLKISPDDDTPLTQMSGAYTQLALYNLRHGKNPASFLRSARMALQKAIAIDSTSFDSYRVQGQVELIEARWALSQRREPDSFFAAAEKSLNRSIELNQLNANAYEKAAEICWWKAKWQIKSRSSAKATIQRGLVLCDKALSLDPKNARAKALKGVLHLELASKETDAPGRVELASRARLFLGEAVRMNPLLNNEFGIQLMQAK